MKKSKVLGTIIVGIIAFSTLQAQPPIPDKGFGKRKEMFEQRIRNLKEKGIITEQEEKEVLDAIEDLKNYRKEVWADDKLTKEEQQTLFEKEKNVREKINNILDKARNFEEKRTPQEKVKFFEERIDNMVKEGRISQKDADELKQEHAKLIDLENEIWSDGSMTKEEHRKLLEARKKFGEKSRKILDRNMKRKRVRKQEFNLHWNNPPIKEGFIPPEAPEFCIHPMCPNPHWKKD